MGGMNLILDSSPKMDDSFIVAAFEHLPKLENLRKFMLTIEK